ncbi:hypothetical protein [Streptomyces sp. enrichment culture]
MIVTSGATTAMAVRLAPDALWKLPRSASADWAAEPSPMIPLMGNFS